VLSAFALWTILVGARASAACCRTLDAVMWRSAVWRQFGAAIDMLDEAVRDCPEELWTAELWPEPAAPGFSAFWYLAFHTLFWLDYSVSGTPDAFAPPEPFGVEEFDPAGKLPPRVYTRGELRDYLAYGRRKTHEMIASASDEQLERPHRAGGGTAVPFGELLVYTMRHVQEHAAQLNMVLGQRSGRAARWVGVAKDA
jgi:hypothetical protein